MTSLVPAQFSTTTADVNAPARFSVPVPIRISTDEPVTQESMLTTFPVGVQLFRALE